MLSDQTTATERGGAVAQSLFRLAAARFSFGPRMTTLEAAQWLVITDSKMLTKHVTHLIGAVDLILCDTTAVAREIFGRSAATRHWFAITTAP